MLSFLSLAPTILLLLIYISIFTFFTLFFVKNIYAKSISLFFGIIGIGYSLIIIINILGNPRPIELTVISKEKYYIISALPVKNKAIYLWTLDLENKIPIYLVIDWSDDLAEQLEKAKMQAQANGGNIVLTENAINKEIKNKNSTNNNAHLVFRVEAPYMPKKDYQ